MSHYTTLLRWPVEQSEQKATSSLAHGQQFHTETYTRLGLSDYPIFNEAYRSQLNDKIIRRYYFREIGQETLELFRWYMRTKMFEIMPYYNQMYESELRAKGLDPFIDTDVERNETWDVSGTRDDATSATHASTTDSTSSAESSGTATMQASDTGKTANRNVFQDTPMSLLDNTTAPTVQGLDYATNVTYDDGTSENSSNTESNTSDTSSNKSNTGVEASDSGTLDSETTEKGKRAVTENGRRTNIADLLNKWRSTFVNIDAMILDDLSELFMGVY